MKHPHYNDAYEFCVWTFWAGCGCAALMLLEVIL
jgi:hypothetical protein